MTFDVCIALQGHCKSRYRELKNSMLEDEKVFYKLLLKMNRKFAKMNIPHNWSKSEYRLYM